ncbi:hypothetical protein ACFY2N_07065 [Streptomyces rubiginosohelvolus]|uniref:hypothetical protein n=1 Tax=Streptomyces rubiginosohelvolus TaxID=67362 RepID=UPI00369F8954
MNTNQSSPGNTYKPGKSESAYESPEMIMLGGFSELTMYLRTGQISERRRPMRGDRIGPH